MFISTHHAYDPQENILFGSPCDEERYKKGWFNKPTFYLPALSDVSAVIYQCALTEDLAMFNSGDETQVGEKGITLRWDSYFFAHCSLTDRGIL